MALSINKTKDLKKSLLKRNVNQHLSKNYDWKVSRAISTDEPLTDEEKAYRASTIAEYNSRIEALDAAPNLDAVKAVDVKF